MTPSDYPACACTLHPSGEDRKKYMFVAEESPTHVVFCCRRCSEISRTPVIQVRTLSKGWERAHHKNLEANPRMDQQKARWVRQLQEMRRRRLTAIRFQEASK